MGTLPGSPSGSSRRRRLPDPPNSAAPRKGTRMSDLNKKTLRHFYCRDVLWQSFERMSEDLDRGVDDLVNEAMRLFAREKGYIPAENESRPSAMRGAAALANRPPP